MIKDSYNRFLKGDDRAFIDIVKEYRDGLILYLNGYVKNIISAEELAEDVFYVLAVKKPKFKNESSFKTYLYAIGKNRALNYIRKTKRRAEVPLEQAADQASLEKIYIKEERKILLHRMLNTLPEDYRAVIYLSYFDGFSNGEIATVLHKSKRQVENLLYRAKSTLKAKLEKEDFVYEEL